MTDEERLMIVHNSDMSGIFKDEGLSIQGRITKLEILLKVCANK